MASQCFSIKESKIREIHLLSGTDDVDRDHICRLEDIQINIIKDIVPLNILFLSDSSL